MIGQETGGETTVALSYRLGSVRQLITSSQAQTLLQSFDPFGNPLASLGEGPSGFGYTGEQTDGSGLVFLRARYYDPGTGRFLTMDPFPGALSVPATQNGYPYGVNNPLKYTDPSGEIIPFILAGIAGGLISGGLNMAMQCIGSSDMDSCMKCMDWGKVGVAVGAGAVAGFVGFGVGLIGGLFGAGILPTILGGIGSGILSGQAYRAMELILTGNWNKESRSSVMWQPRDFLVDGLLGGLGSAASWGVGKAIRNSIKQTEIIFRGRLGGQKHRNMISLVKTQISSQGLNPQGEYMIRTPGGTKKYRFVDVAALDENNVPVAIYQVGKVTKNGFPILRERMAIYDIINFGNIKANPFFIPMY